MRTDAATQKELGQLRRRWWALISISLGELIVALDGTIVYVALPSIQADLQLHQTSLVWVINAFTLTFSGTLLLAGRLGDLYGHRKLFLLGIAMFVLGSLACGLASMPALLVAGRVVQGLSGAIVLSVGFSLILVLFPDSAERAKAMGIHSFICVGGGSAGLMLGGVLTSALNWHWIFFVNIPVGVAVYVLCNAQFPFIKQRGTKATLDIWGAITVTSALALTVHAVVNANETAWAHTFGLLACAAALLVAFVIIESQVVAPLMPLRFFASSTMLIANFILVLSTAGASANFFIALYMQAILGDGPMEIGLAVLPGTLLSALLSLGMSAKIVAKFGIKIPLSVGMAVGAAGLAFLARMPVQGDVLRDVIPGTILLGLAGIANLPLVLANVRGVAAEELGLASGLIGTIMTMCGAVALSVLTNLAATRTERLLMTDIPSAEAIAGGFRAALLFGAGCTLAAAVVSATFAPRR